MMTRPVPPRAEKSSIQWRLKPVKQDPLDAMGFVSKGETRLLSLKTQDSYYQTIVARYMQFCAQYGPELPPAFTTLVKRNGISSANRRDHDDGQQSTISDSVDQAPLPYVRETPQGKSMSSAPNDELSKILLALRKLREGILGSSSTAQSPVFAQRVHVFNIKVAILAIKSESYHPSLTYLLNVLHTREHPLPKSELLEMTTYAILDYALRQNDLIAAYDLKYRSRNEFGYEDRTVDRLLQAVIADNWIAWWRVWRDVDGYVRALMQNYVGTMRRTVLKAFGRAYLKTDLDCVLQGATGSGMTWEELVQVEQVGWQRDGNIITIRKPKVK